MISYRYLGGKFDWIILGIIENNKGSETKIFNQLDRYHGSFSFEIQRLFSVEILRKYKMIQHWTNNEFIMENVSFIEKFV